MPPAFGSLTIDQLVIKIKRAYMGAEGSQSVRHLLKVGSISEASQIVNVLLCESTKLDPNLPGITNLKTVFQNLLLMDIAGVRVISM